VTWRVLADAVLVLHLAFIGFAMLGGMLVLRWPRVAWAHLPTVIWGVTVTVIGGVCPLTPLEKHLRALAGEVPYRGDFISHYIAALIYPPGLTREVQAALGILLLAFNVAIYACTFRRR
jgi:hypothetical protein